MVDLGQKGYAKRAFFFVQKSCLTPERLSQCKSNLKLNPTTVCPDISNASGTYSITTYRDWETDRKSVV